MSTHEKGDGNSNEQMTKEGNKSKKEILEFVETLDNNLQV
jgi:hypothetical protein